MRGERRREGGDEKEGGRGRSVSVEGRTDGGLSGGNRGYGGVGKKKSSRED